ncbi:MAG: globin [Bacteroidetes bacterium]|nr:globin [Bacteroidota bacterium]MBT3801866.1 globin [Bacteroidota bacterium]MBT4338712.1 globin [Bacteroidota bacterium]MBT4729610.1 globin [Bacteroidota bacterium]MBT6837044.1 globin [Bacteroidota bacterium]
MELQITYMPMGSRPAVQKPDPEFLKVLGEDGLRNLVSNQYDLLAKSDIKHLFPAEESLFLQAKKKSADFFVQICGGSPYYNENRGKPMLIDRHKPFRITEEGRLIWLKCYQQLLPELDLPEHLILNFWQYLNMFSIWMINAHE